MKSVKTIKEFWEIQKDQRKYYYLETAGMSDIEVSENNEEIIRCEKVCGENDKIFFEPNNDYGARISVIEKIKAAAKLLPEDVYFMVYSGFRPIEIQEKLYDEVYSEISEKHPELEGEELWNEVTKYVADPKGTPPHSTGGAIDLTLCDKNGVELDMGSRVDEIKNAETFAEGISDEARKNRELLFEVMEKVGFVNLPTEWWHFSYGDRYWAAFNGLNETLYSSQSEKVCPGKYTR